MNKMIYTLRNGKKIGSNQPTAINVLLGFNDVDSINAEYAKFNELRRENYHIDIMTDLSLYSTELQSTLWYKIVTESSMAAGTVPIYQSLNNTGEVDIAKLLDLFRVQAEYGVSIITIHPTVTNELIESSKTRLVPCTSRGGAIVARDFIKNHRKQNVFEVIFEDITSIAKEYGTIISIGSSFRSGTIIDAFDKTYIIEAERQLEIAENLIQEGVSVIIETPGHASLKDIERVCEFWTKSPYPIMPLGPIPTDIGGDMDDVAAVIGASMMGYYGCADILSVVTQEEHSGGIPSLNSIINAVGKYSLAKHIIDICKVGDDHEDFIISKHRAAEHCCNFGNANNCNRCGDFCPLKSFISEA